MKSYSGLLRNWLVVNLRPSSDRNEMSVMLMGLRVSKAVIEKCARLGKTSFIIVIIIILMDLHVDTHKDRRTD